jgi:hypothetical protein
VHFVGALCEDKRIYVTSCAVTESHVEVNVGCASRPGSCRATYVRRSRYDTCPAHITPLDAGDTSEELLRLLPLAAPPTRIFTASFTELALQRHTGAATQRQRDWLGPGCRRRV